jgi:hypothetical protein
LSQDVAPAPSADAQKERAAIVEYDSNVPREWAEGSARLDPDRPPSDVPVKRWQRFVQSPDRWCGALAWRSPHGPASRSPTEGAEMHHD